MIEKLLIVVCVAAMAILGCGSLIDNFTPAEVSRIAADYGEVELDGITTLKDAKQVKVGIAIKHRNVQTNLKRQAEDDSFLHGVANEFVDVSISEAETLQSIVIGSPDNPYSLLGLLAPLGLGGIIGKTYMKRKGDFSPEEHEAEIVKAKNGD